MLIGFGLDVPYTSGTTKKIASAVADNSGTCSAPVAVEQMLADLGYFKGKVDGIFGSDTLAAVKAFEKDSGLPATNGYPKKATCQRLMDAWMVAQSGGGQPQVMPEVAVTGSVLPAPAASKPMPVKQATLADTLWHDRTSVERGAIIAGGFFIVGTISMLIAKRQRT